MFHYQINPDSETPIYRQLAEQIRSQIHSGALKAGTQLPTVREMAEKLHLSCGTVKHVYDCLQETGDIEMTRRRGTFVKYVRKAPDSRKQQAMHAIDQMIRKLTELEFSPAEIQIFLNLKMREWGLRWSGIRMAVVTDYTEMAEAFSRQLMQIGNVHVNVCPLSQLREYPYLVDEQNDVILTSVRDSQTLSYLLPDSSKVIRVAFQIDPQSIRALAACPYPRVGIVCENAAFAQLVKEYLPDHVQCCLLMGEDADVSQLDAVVIAEGCLSERWQERLRDKKIYPFACCLDEGSMLYLEERINKIRDERQQWPGMLRV